MKAPASLTKPARRYLVVIQAPGGYPAPNEQPREPPPDGPREPTLHTAVLEKDYEALEAENERLRKSLEAALARGDG